MVVNNLGQAVKLTDSLPVYKVCVLTKKTRVVNHTMPERSTQLLARVFSDFWGPYKEPTITNKRYILTFTNDYTHKTWVILTVDRTTFLFEFARWKALVKR